MLKRQNRENSQQRLLLTRTSQLRNRLHARIHSLSLLRLRLRDQAPGKGLGLAAMRANTMQLRESRKKTGCPCWDTLTSHIPRQHLCAWWQLPKLAKPAELDMTAVYDPRVGNISHWQLPKPGRVPEAVDKTLRWPWPRGGSSYQAVSRHRLLPTPCWDPKQLGSS